MQKFVMWTSFTLLSLVADFALSFTWSLILTIPLLVACWWVAYRTGWFD